MSSLTWLLLSVAIGDAPDQAVETPTPDQRYEALVRERDEAYRAYTKAHEEAKTPQERDVIPPFNDRNYAGGFLALAEEYPGTPAAEEALLWVCSHTFETRDCEDAKRQLLRDHVRSAKLGLALGFQGHYSDYFEGTESFFRTILAENPHRDIRGLACYWLARHLQHKASGVAWVKLLTKERHAEYSTMYADAYGADWAERLGRLDAGALEREAESLYGRVLAEYAEVPHNDKRRKPAPLGEVARSYLHERRVLSVGKPAPDLEGTDLDGRPFRLADYRGKVVVLDFGSHFNCGLCHLTYPRMRALTERLRDRPFAVVSINAEPEKDVRELKEAWAAEGNTWRCLLDGDWEGPIQKAWNIQQFPTIYVIDKDGIIRFKDAILDSDGNIRFKDPWVQALDEVVDALLRQGDDRLDD